MHTKESGRSRWMVRAAFFGLLAVTLVMSVLFVRQSDRIEGFAKANCQEVEVVKANARNTAWTNFNNLDANLKLLKIAKTDEIVRVAKESRDAVRLRNLAGPCPRNHPTIGPLPIGPPPKPVGSTE